MVVSTPFYGGIALSELNKAITWGFGLGCGCLLLVLFLFFGVMIFGAIIAPDVLLESERVKPAMQPTEMVSARKPLAAPLQNPKEVESAAEQAPMDAVQEQQAPSPQESPKVFVSIAKGVMANLRDVPNGTKTLTRIPQDTRLDVISSRDMRSGALEVTWHEVVYSGQSGWISQYDTTGDLWSHDTTGEISSSRAEGADEVRIAEFSREAKVAFQSWILKNTAATYLEYPQGSDSSIWVRFAPELYETKDSAETAAVRLARDYKLQTGYKGHIIVTVWHHAKDEIFAKGRL